LIKFGGTDLFRRNGINEGDKNQMSSNDELVEEYKEDDGLENIIGSESQSEKVDDTEKSTDEDHFFELAKTIELIFGRSNSTKGCGKSILWR
jgi:hypothetical protein